jgi:hypothetical protein
VNRFAGVNGIETSTSSFIFIAGSLTVIPVALDHRAVDF